MIVTERKFLNDTETTTRFAFLVEKVFSKAYEEKKKGIFISHKHGEEDYVFRLKDLLDKYGFTGYVDWEDDTMPKETSGETARKIKEEIDRACKFILIATNAAIESKWCNWEIGYADTKKFINHIALFPLRKEYDDYKGEEYLQIYPSIQITSNQSNTGSEYYVLYPDGERKTLENWLTL